MFQVLIEIPAQSSPIKYETNEKGEICVDRFLSTPMFYPANYGYIPNTLAEDGDAVDCLVVTPFPIMTGALVLCRPVGLLMMEDEAGIDHKVLAVPSDIVTEEYRHIQSLDDMEECNKGLLDQIEFFFSNYKSLENAKWAEVSGWGTKYDAEVLIRNSSENTYDLW